MPRKEFVQNMFNDIAPSYDEFNHIMSLGVDKTWRRRALKKIFESREGADILDLACGTGDFSLDMARAAGEMGIACHVAGADISAGMLEVMGRKVAKAGFEEKISWLVADAERLPFPDNSFNCVTIAFGIRNFEHREEALKEILRVIRPGGKLLILELSIPGNPIVRFFYMPYFTKVMPFVGGLLSKNKEAYKYLPASVLAFPEKKEWVATMTECGYKEVSHKAFSLGLCRMYIGRK